MKKLILCCITCLSISATQAQYLKLLKEQFETKLKEKIEAKKNAKVDVKTDRLSTAIVDAPDSIANKTLRALGFKIKPQPNPMPVNYPNNNVDTIKNVPVDTLKNNIIQLSFFKFKNINKRYAKKIKFGCNLTIRRLFLKKENLCSI